MANYILRYNRDNGTNGYISELDIYQDSIHIRGTYDIDQHDSFQSSLMRFTKEEALEIASRDCLCHGWFIDTQPANEVLEAININRIIQE